MEITALTVVKAKWKRIVGYREKYVDALMII